MMKHSPRYSLFALGLALAPLTAQAAAKKPPVAKPAASKASAVKPVAAKPVVKPVAATGWVDSLKPKGTPGPLLSLTANKKTAYVLAIPANPTTMDEKAASILSFWLQEITGAGFRVAREGSPAFDNAVRTKAKFISLGRTGMWKAAKLPSANVDLEEEGYAVATQGQNLFLWGGKTRGAIYAVYSLLEEDLGCRWYHIPKSSNRIPKIANLSFRPMLRHFVPVLVVRDPFNTDAFNPEWSLRNKTQGSLAPVPAEAGGYAKHALFVHTYNALVPPSEYFATHPEYYSEIAGKRQPTQLDLSNPDVLRIVVENVKKFLRADPGSKFISVSPNDGRGYCECPICSALDKAEATAPNSKTASLIKFCNEVGEAIEGEFPDVKITTLAYLDTFMPPKTIRPRKNVVIQLCTDAHAWKYPFFREVDSQQFQPAIKAWDAIGADIYIWDYITSYPHHMMPWPNMPIVRDNIKFFMDNGAKGVMLQGNNSVGSENAPMRDWVWAKQLWDPSRDTRTLMRDFIYGYYGSAADPIWKYNMSLWQLWDDNQKKPRDASNLLIPSPANPMMPDWPLLTTKFLDDSMKLFEQAESLAKDPETLQRVKLAKMSIVYVKLARALGFYPEFGAFRPGPWARSGDMAEQPALRAMFNEFKEVTHKAGMVNISERQDMGMINGNWQKMLDRDWPKLPILPLSATWKFKTDAKDEGQAATWFSRETDDSTWSDIKVSSNRLVGWESLGYADYKGTAWYRQKLTVPTTLENKGHLYLFFGAVDAECEIYINGVKAFEHTRASTGLTPETIWNAPFFFDAAPFLKIGESNDIALKVSSFGGIRGVWQPAFLISNDKPLSTTDFQAATIPYIVD